MTGLGFDKKENKGEDGGRDINMSGLPMDEGQGLCVGEVLLQAMLLQVVVLLQVVSNMEFVTSDTCVKYFGLG